MEIRIGTSGYSFEDWRGYFYPAGIKSGKMLDYYQNFFKTVEINSTYYRIPHPKVMENIAKKVGPDFDFMIKAGQNMTHERMNYEAPARQLLNAIKPVSDYSAVSGILAQFPWSFRYSRRNLEYLLICRDLVRDYPLYVEFRHNSWLRDVTYLTFKDNDIRFVSVDGPRLRGLLPPQMRIIGDTAYVRLHGRNAEKWWEGGPDRYNYLYNVNELQEWREKIAQLDNKTKKAYIFFNNCHLGQAVKNARQLMQMLDL